MTEEELEEKHNEVCIELCGANCLLDDDMAYIAIDHGYGVEFTREQLETRTVEELIQISEGEVL
jgi:hypothetical protein